MISPHKRLRPLSLGILLLLSGCYLERPTEPAPVAPPSEAAVLESSAGTSMTSALPTAPTNQGSALDWRAIASPRGTWVRLSASGAIQLAANETYVEICTFYGYGNCPPQHARAWDRRGCPTARSE